MKWSHLLIDTVAEMGPPVEEIVEVEEVKPIYEQQESTPESESHTGQEGSCS